jgi:hypothetical protein
MSKGKPVNKKAKVRCSKIYCIPVKKGAACNVLYVFYNEAHNSPVNLKAPDINCGRFRPLSFCLIKQPQCHSFSILNKKGLHERLPSHCGMIVPLSVLIDMTINVSLDLWQKTRRSYNFIHLCFVSSFPLI